MNCARTTRGWALAVCIGLCGAAPLAAQSPTGPQVPAKAPEIIRVPTEPTPDKPPIPAEEMIRRFAAQEDAFARARQGYGYRRTVRLDELGLDGKPAGSAEVATDYEISADGNLHPRTVKKPESTLHVVGLEPDALEMLARIPPFPLVTAELPKYDVTYQTMEAVDELTTYVFRVTPKQLDRTHAYFSGLIWVDDHDLAIVKTYGKWVSESGDISPPQLPFTTFETYRQPVSNKDWLPAYSRSDGSLRKNDSNVPLRLIIRWDNYKAYSPSQTSAAPAPAAPTDSSR